MDKHVKVGNVRVHVELRILCWGVVVINLLIIRKAAVVTVTIHDKGDTRRGGEMYEISHSDFTQILHTIYW